MKRKQFVKLKQTDAFLSSFEFVKLETLQIKTVINNVWITNGGAIEYPYYSSDNYVHGQMSDVYKYGLINGHIVYETECLLAGPRLSRDQNGVLKCSLDGLWQVLRSGKIPRKVPDYELRRLWEYTTEGLAHTQRLKDERNAAVLAKHKAIIDGLGVFDQELRQKLHSFLLKLEKFDWYYSYSDDVSVWRAGSRREQELEAEARMLGFPELFDQSTIF